MFIIHIVTTTTSAPILWDLQVVVVRSDHFLDDYEEAWEGFSNGLQARVVGQVNINKKCLIAWYFLFLAFLNKRVDRVRWHFTLRKNP